MKMGTARLRSSLGLKLTVVFLVSELVCISTAGVIGIKSTDDKKSDFTSWPERNAFSDEPGSLFSSWGKNHNVDDFQYNKKAFNVWAGKRSLSDDSDSKRAAFNAWAGKRSTDFTNNVERGNRAFSVWSGKRMSDGSDEKLSSFSALAGKRSTEDTIPAPKRAAFNAWAGKRNTLDDLENAEVKRSFYSSLAGKRLPSNSDHETDYINQSAEKRAAFAPWSGKRSIVNPQPHLKLIDLYLSKVLANAMEKRKFSVWAGKRMHPMSVYRRRFQPWSG